MNKINLFSIAAAIMLTCFTGCGGESDDNDTNNDLSNMEGTWTGAVTKTSDNCSAGLYPQTVTFSHRVNQNSIVVSLDEAGGIDYVGNTQGNNGFEVNSVKTQISAGKSCVYAKKITYDEIDNDSDKTGSIELRIGQDCEGSDSCTVRYSGTASRTGGAATSPTPTASASPSTPVAGGCGAINEHPAAGTYSGNGKCGISDVQFQSLTQGTEKVVVLTPFGANGATSFGYGTPDVNTATSKRNDLTINGEVGYSCAIICSPPSTFSISCFKEGGTTCIEKF